MKISLIDEIMSYSPHVLSGSYGNRGATRSKLIQDKYLRTAYPWYRTWLIMDGSFRVLETDEVIFAPRVIVQQPEQPLRVKLSAASHFYWLEWGVRHQPLILRQQGAGWKYHMEADQRWEPSQPDAVATWGEPWPMILPSGLYEYTRSQMQVMLGEWWRDSLSYAHANALLAAWIVRVNRALSEKETAAQSHLDDETWTAYILRVLENHLESIHSVRSWASLLGMNPVTFRQKCQRESRKSPREILDGVRFSRACVLLETTKLPIGQVAQMVGYPAANAFGRWFREKTDQSPRQWRMGRRII